MCSCVCVCVCVCVCKLRRSLLQTLTEWNSGKSSTRLMCYWKLCTHRHDSVESPGDRACTFQCYDRLFLVRGLNTSDAISGWISGELIIDRNTTVYWLKYLILFLTHNVPVFFLVFQSCSNGSLYRWRCRMKVKFLHTFTLTWVAAERTGQCINNNLLSVYISVTIDLFLCLLLFVFVRQRMI